MCLCVVLMSVHACVYEFYEGVLMCECVSAIEQTFEPFQTRMMTATNTLACVHYGLLIDTRTCIWSKCDGV